MDPWVNKTIFFQRQLDMNTPISGLQILGTHNSFNNKADGYADRYIGGGGGGENKS